MNSGWNISATTGLANRTFSLLSDLTGVSRAWLIFLIDPKLDREPELRSSIFAIYVAALADAANEMESRIAGLVREAKRLGSKSCIYYLGAFSEYLAGTLDMLSVFERDDMIFITEIRNQRVHAHLDESHKASRRVRFMDGGRLRTVKIPSEEYLGFIQAHLRESGEHRFLYREAETTILRAQNAVLGNRSHAGFRSGTRVNPTRFAPSCGFPRSGCPDHVPRGRI